MDVKSFLVLILGIIDGLHYGRLAWGYGALVDFISA